MKKFIRGLQNINSQHRNCVATIGNFDGVHKGHQQLLTNLYDEASRQKLPSVLITFEPQPQEYFNKVDPPPRLTSFREKMTFLKDFPLDYMLCLPFNGKLVNLLAEDFIVNILVKNLGIKSLLVGDDFRFGYQRQGDFGLLEEQGKVHGFRVTRQPALMYSGNRISSSWVRSALQLGDLSLARTLLGRPYTMCGKVVYGDKKGRELGFPTANINLQRRVSPLKGVFAVKLNIDSEPKIGMANIGIRPTINGLTPLLETHIFDFDQEIYGRYIEIEFVKKLRDEKRFNSLEELKQQLSLDANNAKACFT